MITIEQVLEEWVENTDFGDKVKVIVSNNPRQPGLHDLDRPSPPIIWVSNYHVVKYNFSIFPQGRTNDCQVPAKYFNSQDPNCFEDAEKHIKKLIRQRKSWDLNPFAPFLEIMYMSIVITTIMLVILFSLGEIVKADSDWKNPSTHSVQQEPRRVGEPKLDED